MSHAAPKRIVLKCPERHWKTQNEMLKAFFDSQGLDLDKDLFTHILFEPSSPSYLFFVIDLHCKTIPDINLSQLELQIFKVSKKEPFTFTDLGDVGRKQARPRSLDTPWGTDERTGISQTN
ncbi:hypothetical protein BU26DRAFT_526129 [Trematosphaeria pertusa]|uniref:Uncharacterized protein n=1 Tax=Trematosphaeria pertusa TaxID=390896 RepID=A0A6A6HQJ6_9PLEO|nr:uncharacterized protein BU26DRAFT_526129 [Trematosphaeria pertusa]KAF2240287.1 hypothetical protein BU26DRAFT_526129 [Trematosphaeria pertusa]